MRPLRSRAGQIVIPAMLIFPSLLLFVYLIYETAKLSREKIRHQFAVDAAAFVEAANYSDFLNRTAYVNGAFPMRIFQQGYHDWKADCEGKVEHCEDVTYEEILYRNGVFPRSMSDKAKMQFSGDDAVWDIGYGGPSAERNSNPPTLKDPMELFTVEDCYKFWHSYELASEIYKLYVQVFSLLGSVEDAQLKVLKKLSTESQHSFLQKSYWLNTGDPAGYGSMLAQNFDNSLGGFNPKAHCVRQVVYHGNQHRPGAGIQSLRPATSGPIDVSSPGCEGGGLFQLMTVDDSSVRKFKEPNGGDYPGLPLSLAWAFPRKNYFNVDFASVMRMSPVVHTTVSIGVNSKAAVWPNPTPKFQVREYP